MKPLLWPSRIRLPRPRTPLPAYMTLPSAAAVTGAPTAPSMSMPLVVELKHWMILPPPGQPQEISPASLARDAEVETGAAASPAAGPALPPLAGEVLTGEVVAVAPPAGMGVLPSRRRTWPMDNWVGSVMLFSCARRETSMPWLWAIL